MRTRPALALAGWLLVLALLALIRPVHAQGPHAALLAACDGGDGLYLYADRNYAGQCLKITEDTPRLGELGFNDVTSSIRFVGSFAGGHRFAELYVDGNYGGDIQIVSSDVPWMGETVVGNDRLSSVRLGFRCSGVTQIPQAECQALVDLYNQTHGPGWRTYDGWLQTGTPCTWWGVQCTDGHVFDVDLYNNGLSGTLPASLGNLSNLYRLMLDVNSLTGSIPSSLGNLGSLWVLSLPSNQLSGGIPSSLGNLNNLEYLYLQHNQLSGGIPDSLRYLSSLIELYVQDNPLGGALPVTLMEMTNLEALHFEQTGLCEPSDAAFQAWLGSLPECGRTGVLCEQPSPTPTATRTGVPEITPTATRTGTSGITPTPTATSAAGALRRVYLPVVLRGYALWADDEFNSPRLDPRWHWVNEDPAGWSLTEHPGYLNIRTHPGQLWDKNVLLRTPPGGDWGVRTHVSFAPAANFQSAGILIWGGTGNALRLARAYCDVGPPNCVGDGIYFDRFEGGEWVGTNYATPWPSTSPVHLRIDRVGPEYQAYCSLDGVHWIWLGSHTPGFTVTGVGLTASQGTPGSTNDADFDYFRVSGS